MNNNNDIKIYALAVIIASVVLGIIALIAAIMGHTQHLISTAVCAVMAWVHLRELKQINNK